MPTIIDMVNHTRLDCILGVAAGARWGTAAAIHHCTHREAFGKRLTEQPLMQNVLADLAIESEAATVAAMRMARAFDEAHAGDEAAVEFRRLATPVLKYWTCKRAPVHAVEALECLGGNGYVEESGMPRLYRESPLASIWEGSGNVQCLDVLRAMARNPRVASRPSSPRSRRRAARSRASTQRSPTLRDELVRPRGDRDPRPQRGRADGARAPGLAAGSLRRSGGRRRVLRLAPRRRLRVWRSAPCPAAPTSAASSSATRPTCTGLSGLYSQRSSRRRTTASVETDGVGRACRSPRSPGRRWASGSWPAA